MFGTVFLLIVAIIFTAGLAHALLAPMKEEDWS